MGIYDFDGRHIHWASTTNKSATAKEYQNNADDNFVFLFNMPAGYWNCSWDEDGMIKALIIAKGGNTEHDLKFEESTNEEIACVIAYLEHLKLLLLKQINHQWQVFDDGDEE